MNKPSIENKLRLLQAYLELAEAGHVIEIAVVVRYGDTHQTKRGTCYGWDGCSQELLEEIDRLSRQVSIQLKASSKKI
ncbi:MAG: hypothetical protein V3R83_09640 [Gammaproteobacteria bacterium]